ncbi:MAG: TIGR00374 family protein, partial [Acidimicrobiales bacterium]
MRRSETAAVVGGAAVLTGTWVAVKLADTVPSWEERVFRRVNGLPDTWWPVVWVPMQLGSLAGSIVVVAATQVATGDRRLALAALGTGQAGWWAGQLVKVLASRARPAALLGEVRLREAARGLGYLSGHAAVSFALAWAGAPALSRRWE